MGLRLSKLLTWSTAEERQLEDTIVSIWHQVQHHDAFDEWEWRMCQGTSPIHSCHLHVFKKAQEGTSLRTTARARLLQRPTSSALSALDNATRRCSVWGFQCLCLLFWSFVIGTLSWIWPDMVVRVPVGMVMHLFVDCPLPAGRTSQSVIHYWTLMIQQWPQSSNTTPIHQWWMPVVGYRSKCASMISDVSSVPNISFLLLNLVSKLLLEKFKWWLQPPWCSCIHLPFVWNKGLETADLGSEYQNIAQNFFTPHLPPSPEFQSHWSRILADLVAKFTWKGPELDYWNSGPLLFTVIETVHREEKTVKDILWE